MNRGARSGLLGALSAGVSSAESGQVEGDALVRQALIAKIQRDRQARLDDLQASNIASEIAARNKPQPTTMDERYTSDFDALVAGGMKPEDADAKLRMRYGKPPLTEHNPTMGSQEWLNAQEALARIHKKYHVGESTTREDIPVTHAATTVGQQINTTESDLGRVNTALKTRFENVAPVRGKKALSPDRETQFVSDSTDFANLTGRRKALETRADSLTGVRDQIARKQQGLAGLDTGGASTTTPSKVVRTAPPPKTPLVTDQNTTSPVAVGGGSNAHAPVKSAVADVTVRRLRAQAKAAIAGGADSVLVNKRLNAILARMEAESRGGSTTR